jgi:hypothetical protein
MMIYYLVNISSLYYTTYQFIYGQITSDPCFSTHLTSVASILNKVEIKSPMKTFLPLVSGPRGDQMEPSKEEELGDYSGMKRICIYHI